MFFRSLKQTHFLKPSSAHFEQFQLKINPVCVSNLRHLRFQALEAGLAQTGLNCPDSWAFQNCGCERHRVCRPDAR